MPSPPQALTGPASAEETAGLATRLRDVGRQAGCSVAGEGPRFSGVDSAIIAGWWFGSRRVTYRYACDLDPSQRLVRFREAIAEVAQGLPPPALTFRHWRQSGLRYRESREDLWPGGHGRVRFGRLRAEVEAIVRAAGWRFELEATAFPAASV